MAMEFISGSDGRVRRTAFLLVCAAAVLLLLASCGSGARDAGEGLSEAVVVDVEGHEDGDEHAAEEHEATPGRPVHFYQS